MREFAAEQLGERGEAGDAQARHATYFAGLVAAMEPQLRGTEQTRLLRMLEREHDNLRAVLRLLREQREIVTGMQVAFALWRFWLARGHLREGQMWLTTFLGLDREAGEITPPALRRDVLFAAGRLMHLSGGFSEAQELFTELLARARVAEDNENTAAALTQLGVIALAESEHEIAYMYHQEALSIREMSGDHHAIARALMNLGQGAVVQGDSYRARAFCLRALTLLREYGDPYNLVTVLRDLGHAALNARNIAESRGWYAEGLTIAEELQAPAHIAACITGVAALAAHEGAYERATPSRGNRTRIT